MAVDLKAETPDTSIDQDAFLFGADSQAAASPSVFSVKNVLSAFINKVVTIISALTKVFFRRVQANPSANSTAVAIGHTSKVDYVSTSYDITGAGHLVGGLNWVAHQTTRTLALVIAQEAKFDNESTGTITTLVVNEAQVSSNAGTIGTLIGHRSAVTGNAGTINTFVGFMNPDLSALSGITAKQAFYNEDPEAIVLSKGAVIDQSIAYDSPSATGFTVTIPPRRSIYLLTPVADYAAGTINMPAKATVQNGQLVEITISTNLTAVTWGLNGSSLVFNGPTGLVVGQTVRFRYFGQIDWWVRV